MPKQLSEKKRKWIERTVGQDRRYKLLVYNRVFLCALFIALQAGVFLLLLSYLGAYAAIVQAFFSVAAAIFVLFLAGREKRRPTRVLWIILILAMPIVGVALYFFYGGSKSGAALRKGYAQAAQTLGQAPMEEGVQAAASSGRDGAVATVLGKVGYPAFLQGDVAYFSTGKQLFEGMKEALRSAKKFIFLEYFIISGGVLWDEVKAILLEKAMEGVEIKIIYDDFGSLFSLPPKYDEYLESLHENIRCLAFNKVYPIFMVRYNHRDHRKILVVDGCVAFTGGLNLADEYVDAKRRFGYWKDTGVRITGGAVDTFTRIFLSTWIAFKEKGLDGGRYLTNQTGGVGDSLILPYADGPLDDVSIGEYVYLDMIHRAHRRLWIMTPYLVLDDFLKLALMDAAARGVDVRIITPGIPDKKMVFRVTRANYSALLKAGVKIYEYTPGFLHAKAVLSDDCAVVGSINFDYRSLYLHFENAVYFHSGGAIADLERDFLETCAVSWVRTLQNTKRTFFGRMCDTLLRLFEPLL